MIDSSGSVGKKNFEKMKNFVAAVSEKLDIENGNVRVGLVTFNSEVYVQFNLGDKSTSSEVVTAITATVYTHGTTNTGGALQTVYSTMLTPANGDRQTVPNIIVVMTDGGSNDKNETQKHARQAKKLGNTILSLGVGDWLDQQELQTMASHPSKSNTINVESFDDLNNVIPQVLTAICNGKLMIPCIEYSIKYYLLCHCDCQRQHTLEAGIVPSLAYTAIGKLVGGIVPSLP